MGWGYTIPFSVHRPPLDRMVSPPPGPVPLPRRGDPRHRGEEGNHPKQTQPRTTPHHGRGEATHNHTTLQGGRTIGERGGAAAPASYMIYGFGCSEYSVAPAAPPRRRPTTRATTPTPTPTATATAPTRTSTTTTTKDFYYRSSR